MEYNAENSCNSHNILDLHDMYISFKDIYLGEIFKSNTTGDTSGAETTYPS
jgi:hypothetical protein